jgi:hypothetical protein
MVGVVSSCAPAALRAHCAVPRTAPASEQIETHGSGSHLRELPAYCTGPYQPGLSRPTNQGVSDTGSLSLHRPTLLARRRRLVVPPSRYMVGAAPAHRVNSRGRLPSASPSCCGKKGRAPHPHGITAPRGARRVEARRGAGLSASPFPRSALRTGRAPFSASGSP